MRTHPCRCGGKTRLEFKQERTSDISIKGVPVLVCTRCGEEWYPPGIATMIEGIREAVKNLDKSRYPLRGSRLRAREERVDGCYRSDNK